MPEARASLGAMIAFSETLRAQLLDLWVRVTDAGGAVGFVAPADPADPAAVARLLDASLARVSSGEHVLGVIRRDQTAVGMGFLVSGGSPLRAHWRTVLQLMVDPALQGTGAGRILLDSLHGLAAELGLEHLMLTVRGGLESRASTSVSDTGSSAHIRGRSASPPETTGTSS